MNNVSTNQTVNFIGSGNNIIVNCEPNPNSGALSGPLTISGHVTSAGHAVPGAQIKLNGGTQGVRIGDEAGAFSFSVNAGSYSLNIAGGGCASFSPSVVNLNNVTNSKTQNFSGTSCPPAPLALCPLLSTEFTGESGGAVCATQTTSSCPDAVGTWDSAIVLDFGTLVTSDCRFGQWSTGLLTSTDVINYLVDLTSFTLQFFGCPFVGQLTGPLAFQVIPAALASRTFTTADLQTLSSLYVQAINQAISDNGSPALTPAQLASINAQLTFLQGTVAHQVTSSTFTFSTCP